MNDIGFRKKRVFAGLGMLVAAVALGFLLQNYIGPASQMWQRFVYIVAVLGTGISGILLTFMGWHGILYGYGFVAIIGSINVLPEILPEPWNRYYVFLYVLVMVGWSSVNKNKKNTKGNKKNKSEEQKKTAKEPAPGEQSMLLAYGMVNGNFYQLLRTAGEIRAYFVGGELKGINEKQVQDPKKPLRPIGKKDISIPIDGIRSVKYKEYSGNTMFDCAFILHAGKKYRFCPLDPEDIPKYMTFFQRWMQAPKNIEKASLQPKLLEILRKVHFAIGAYILLVSLCWLFLDVPYRLFSVLAMISFPILMALYAIFPDYFTVLEKTRSTTNISIAVTAVGACIVVTLRTLMDFNILQWGRLLILCGIALVLCMAALMLLTKEWKQKSLVLLYFLLMLVFYLPGTLGQINCTFDNHEPQVYQGTVTDLSISTSSKGPDSYHVDVLLRNGNELELETNPEHYASLSVGDSIEVAILDGVLGVPHAYLN